MSASTPPAAATVFLLDAFTHRFWSAPAAESCASHTTLSVTRRHWQKERRPSPGIAMTQDVHSRTWASRTSLYSIATSGWMAPACDTSVCQYDSWRDRESIKALQRWEKGRSGCSPGQ